jgi:hypothetical protein
MYAVDFGADGEDEELEVRAESLDCGDSAVEELNVGRDFRGGIGIEDVC